MPVRGITYFGNNLPKKDFNDDDLRLETLRKGCESLKDVPSVTQGTKMKGVCAMTIEMESDAVRENVENILATLNPPAR